MSERYEVKDRVALSVGVVVEVHHETTHSLFGELEVWWVTFGDTECCARVEKERRHIERTDAIEHGRTLVRLREWQIE